MPDWMAFNVDDYVSNTMHLTTRQHGGYILLICAAWKAKGLLPGSDAALMAIAKLSAKEWREDGDVLKAFLTERGDGWVHERVEFEWKDAQALIDAKSKAGREGARKRWHGRRIAEPSQTQRQNDAPQPSPKPVSEAKASGAGAPARQVIFEEALPWLVRRSGLDDRACRSIIGKWLKEYGDEPVLAAMQQAEQENPVDPVPWIVAKFKPRESWNEKRIRLGMEAIHS